jgi:GAF domain-containing protein
MLAVRGGRRERVDKTEQALERELRAISNCNQTLLRAVEEQSLLDDICRIVCEDAGYRMAWVGLPEGDEHKSVRVAAVAGREDGYLTSTAVSWADVPEGQGPTGTALRTGRTQYVTDLETDPRMARWRDSALQRGYRSSIALPLRGDHGPTLGALTIYSEDPSAFTPGEVKLLEQLAADLTFGIATVRCRAIRATAEATLVSTTRALRALSGVNESLVRAQSEQDLLSKVCEAIVASGGYGLTWVGYVQHDEARSVIAVEHAGPDAGLLDGLVVTWGEGPRGNGAIGRSIRGRTPVVVRNIQRSEMLAAWRDEVRTWGLQSVISLPLIDSAGESFGAVAVYSHDPEAFGDDETDLLSHMAEDLSYGIEALRSRQLRERAEDNALRTTERLRAALFQITETMGKVVELRDPYTQGHQRRVAVLAGLIAEEMGLPHDQLEPLETAALIHDVGKLAVPAEILTKPGGLSDTEFELIKVHSQAGYDLLHDVDFGWPVADVVLQHHERMDGSGYPNGLQGDEISMGARILMVADVIEAMASHRPYRPSLGLGAAMAEITGSPQKFDGQVLAACVRLNESGQLEAHLPSA